MACFELSPHDSIHDRLYKRACNLIDGLILFHDRASDPLEDGQRAQLQDAVGLFQEVLCIDPANWSALWLLGKIYQRLDDHESALRYFARANQISPAEPDVAREAAIAAMELGRPLEAVSFAERAVAARPADAGLRANLTLALLFSQRAPEALAVAEEALRADPGDDITARIVAAAREVVSGKRSCPRHVRDLD